MLSGLAPILKSGGGGGVRTIVKEAVCVMVALAAEIVIE